MEKAEFSLVIAQIVVLVINFFIYGRQKSALDVEKRDRGTFGATVADALRLAESAKRGVEEMDTTKYKKVLDGLVECCAENAKLKSQIAACDESIKSLSNKLASRVKTERKQARDDEYEDEVPPVPPTGRVGASTLDEQMAALEKMKEMGIAVPMFQQVEDVPQSPRRPGFGRQLAKGA